MKTSLRKGFEHKVALKKTWLEIFRYLNCDFGANLIIYMFYRKSFALRTVNYRIRGKINLFRRSRTGSFALEPTNFEKYQGID